MKFSIKNKVECFFGFFGAIIALVLAILAAIFTEDYNPLFNTVSSLGEREAKSLFSISFVIGGTLSIPFYISLERELANIHDNIRRLATGISIMTSVCVALVGIIPDETYLDLFLIFHGFVAFFSFVGSGIYIGLFSILIYSSSKSEKYSGINFHRILAYFGFLISGTLIIFLLTLYPIIEWILAVMIVMWIILTSFHLITSKFISIPVVYLRRIEYPKKVKFFEEIIQVLSKLEMENEPITGIIEENLDILKKKRGKVNLIHIHD
jgi:hypothetical protein